MKKTLFVLFCAFILWPYPTFGLENLDFETKLTPSASFKVNRFLNAEYKTDISLYDIAMIDLNHDSINEYILRRRYCSSDKYDLCTHLVLAESKDEIVPVLNIRTRSLSVANTNTYNIRDLLSFDNALNDFYFVRYIWSPAEKMYILGSEK